MDKKDWELLKADPGYRQEVEAALKTYLNESEFQRASKLLALKLSLDSYEQAASFGRRPILDVIKDNKGVLDDNEENIYDALRNMSPAETLQYDQDSGFRQAVNEAVESVLDSGAEQEVAFAILKKNDAAAAQALIGTHEVLERLAKEGPVQDSKKVEERYVAMLILAQSKPAENDCAQARWNPAGLRAFTRCDQFQCEGAGD